jgi:hypothetical protein
MKIHWILVIIGIPALLLMNGCSGTRSLGQGTKKVKNQVVHVLATPSRLLAGDPPNYAAKQGLTPSDQEAERQRLEKLEADAAVEESK